MPDTPTRDEIGSKLEAAEARTETRFAHLVGTIDVRFAQLDHKIDRLIDNTASVASLAGDLKREVRELKADNKTTRNLIVVTVIASVLAGLAALWVTQANLLSTFQLVLAVKPAASVSNK